MTDALGDPVRLAALRATGMLDSPPSEPFERLTRLAAEILETPLALVNLVDDQRQFSAACVAPASWPPEREAPLADSFCKWAVIERVPVVIPDARVDTRVRTSAMITGLNVVAYLGVPLLLSTGEALGTLCVAGFEPRRWTERDVRLLRDLAASVVTEIELRLDVLSRRQVERLKDEFVSIVAHELRTPLTSIRGSLGLLASGRMDPGSPQARRLLEIASQNSDRLVRLVNDMLDLNRIESGALDLEPRRVGAAEMVGAAVDAVRGLASEAGVQVETFTGPGVVAWADHDRIVQVLVNLVSNAIKFSSPPGRVEVHAEGRGGQVLFQVRDQGRGIPADKLDLIFERFRQVESGDARDKGGTGLGLAISRSIVLQHGGRIWVASELGRGSTFYFTLPAHARTPAPGEQVPA